MPFMTVGHQKIHYQDRGSGFPLLLGHSYLWDSAMWSPQLETLSQQYRCLAPDLPGHGQSDPWGRDSLQLNDLVQLHENFLNALGVEQCAVLGLSVGGMWAGPLALRLKERVKALVLMDTFLGPEPLPTQQRYFQMLDAVEGAGLIPPPILEAIQPLFFSQKTLGNSEIPQEFKKSLQSLSPAQVTTIVALGRAIFSRPSLLSRLPELSLPTLLLVGEEDRSRPPAECEHMEELLPNAQMHVITDAGHISNLENPQAVTAVIQSFLKRTLPPSPS